MPPHRTYIETHLGHGAVLRHKKPAQESFGYDRDPTVIAWWADRTPSGCTIEVGDGIAQLKAWRFTGEELVYCDPPYLAATRRSRGKLYRHDYSEADHVAALAVLRNLPCSVILSGYASKLYADLLPGWQRIDIPGWSQAGAVIESLWVNYTPSDDLHDYQHIGATFREREQIRRRRSRVLSRIQALPTPERLAMLEELAAADAPAFLAVASRLHDAKRSAKAPLPNRDAR
ncbi:hypothetical protein ASF53_11635 [Methylobacterium sp. Leaf123]|nr:hypothetical protein ASF53_11635 [Methylobacterium sp. Leaf123]